MLIVNVNEARCPSGIALHFTMPQVRGSISGLGKVHSCLSSRERARYDIPAPARQLPLFYLRAPAPGLGRSIK